MGVVVGVQGAGGLGGAGARHGSDAAVDETGRFDVLAEELAFSQGVLIYAPRLLRLFLLGGLVIGLPVVGLAAARVGSPEQTGWTTHFFLPPTLRPKNETIVKEWLWFILRHYCRESQRQNSSGKCPSSPTFTWASAAGPVATRCRRKLREGLQQFYVSERDSSLPSQGS